MLRVLAGLTVLAALTVTGCSSQEAPPPAAQPSTAAPSAVPVDIKPLPEGTPFDIGPETLTIHSFHADPQTKSTSFRMNCWPLWRDVEPSRGQYNWELFDQTLAAQQAYGARS